MLPIDARAFRAHARLMHRKSDAHFEDAMIAAVAQTNGLIVATRNVKDFAGFGVRTVDLWPSSSTTGSVALKVGIRAHNLPD